MQLRWCALLVLAGWACDDADPGNQQVIEIDARVRDQGGPGGMGGDGGGPGGAGGEDADQGIAGEGGEGGVGGVGGDGGAGGGIRDIEDCADACAVYDDCDRTADLFPGGNAECLERCAEAEGRERFVNYLTCMQITRCEELQDCRLPQPPPPMCADVCGAIAACDDSFRLPDGLPEVADCMAACGEDALASDIVECARHVLDDACDEPAFAGCMLDERGDDCVEACRARAECEDGLDPVDCTIECLNTPLPEDPVAARRVELDRNCARNAANCDELAACAARNQRPIVGDATIEEMCAANADCGFLTVETCAEDAEPLLRRLADGAIDCFTDHFQNACGEPPYDCFTPAPAPERGCEEHCRVSDICGLLPEDELEVDCLEPCQAALASMDPVLINPYLPLFECATLDSCPAVRECQRLARPNVACREVCQTQIECRADGNDECLDECLEGFNTDRSRAERACSFATEGCDNVNLCVTPGPPNCALYCDPLDECGEAVARCPLDCDNAHFADPSGFLPAIACLNGSDRCSDRRRCLDGELERGLACHAYCAATVACNPQALESMEDCVVRCARDGIAGEQGLTFEAATACLVEEGPDGDCDTLRACLNEADPDDACPAYCAELDRCLLTEDVAACEAACRATDEPNERADIACVVNGARRNANCGVAAACIDAQLPPISRACGELCDAQARCDDAIDPFLCGQACDPDEEGLAIRAGCATVAPCAQQMICDDPIDMIPPDCNEGCGVIAGCDGDLINEEDGLFADFAHCQARCAGASMILGEGFPSRLGECVNDVACDREGVAECFTVADNLCEAGQEAVTACGLDQPFLPGLPPAVENYQQQCEALPPDQQAQQVACLQDVADRAAAGDPFACLEAFGCL